MIVRYNCFETNSSSTHALCIAKRGLESPYKLIAEYINDYYYFGDDLPKENKYLKLKDNRIDCDDDYCHCGSMTIKLRRFENIGRVFDIYNSVESKLNFVWSILVSELKYKDEIKERKGIDVDELFKLFLQHLYTNGFKLRFLDIVLRDEKPKEKENIFAKIICLGQIPDYDFIPSKIKNKYMYGEETYGYFPLEELDKIIRSPILFWNLILGESKIYTGSDEENTFEDLTFDDYSYKLVGGSDSDICVSENIFKSRPIKQIGEYKNGNYITKLYADGTRTRELFPKETFYDQSLYREDKFKMKEIDIMEPEFPESIDLKITNYCENNCKYCYANSNKEGKHANKNFIKDIISEMKPYTEIAIGGGNALAHPDLIEILQFAKERNVICNITLKDIDVINNKEKITKMFDNKLIKALGISPTTSDTINEAIEYLNNDCYRNFVLHLILGVHDKKFLNKLKDNYIPAILFLGYKQKGLGDKYYNKNKETINNKLIEIKNMKYNELTKISTTISFDNLAIEQLELDTENVYKDLYQGNDGKFSFYIDAVEEKYAKSSMEEKTDWFYNIKDAFKSLKKGV